MTIACSYAIALTNRATMTNHVDNQNAERARLSVMLLSAVQRTRVNLGARGSRTSCKHRASSRQLIQSVPVGPAVREGRTSWNSTGPSPHSGDTMIADGAVRSRDRSMSQRLKALLSLIRYAPPMKRCDRHLQSTRDRGRSCPAGGRTGARRHSEQSRAMSTLKQG